MSVKLSKKDAKALLARNATGSCTPTSMAAWVNGSLVLELPHPPTVNTYWRHYRGRMVIGKEGKAFRENVESVLGPKDSVISKRVSVEIDWYAPDHRKRDIDNITKGLFDALTYAAVWVDDSQVDLLTIRRCPVTHPGRVVVRIRERGA